VVERLDEERLETLRTWGAGLSTSARDELRAAGKAILMLVDELDRLEADLWNARADAKQAEAAAAAARQADAARTVPETPVETPAPVAEAPAERPRPPAHEPRERQAPVVEPSQVLAMTLSERIARGRPAPSEPAA
jgi:hypothetical protein